MKRGPVTKLGKKNTSVSKNFDDDFILSNRDVIVIGSRISDALCLILTFSLIVTFYLTKTENKTKKISNAALTLLL